MIHSQLYIDYIRQLTQARELLLNERMIKGAPAGDDGAWSALDSICRRLVGVPHKVVRRTSPDRLRDLIRSGGHANISLILVGELLRQDVELSEKIGNVSQATVSRLQAFCLLIDSLSFLEPEEQTEYRKKLDVLAAELESTSDDPYLRNKIESYRSMKFSA